MHQEEASPCPVRPLFYVVDWLPPDFGAVGQYALNAARTLASQGRQVYLIGLTTGPPAREVIRYPIAGGVLTIERLTARPYDKANAVRRLLWTMVNNARLMRAVLRHPRSSGADLQFTGAPPFMLYFALPAKWLRRARLIYRTTDLYPEVVIAHLGRRSMGLALLERFTWLLRRRIDAFEALGQDQHALLMRGGIGRERIVIKRDTTPVTITGQERPAQRPSALGDHKVLLYSGNYGIAHEAETVAEGLARHHRSGNGRFALWLNATGRNADWLAQRLAELKVPFARTPPAPLEDVGAILAAADAHLIALRAGFAGIVFPSKVYACVQSRRPLVFVGPEESDVHLLCSNARQSYIRVEPGDADGFACALDRLASFGRNG